MKKSQISTPSIENEYHIVQLDRGVRGVPGNMMRTDDPRRVRHYVRATSEAEAIVAFSRSYPNPGDLAVINVVENVAPLFKAA